MASNELSFDLWFLLEEFFWVIEQDWLRLAVLLFRVPPGKRKKLFRPFGVFIAPSGMALDRKIQGH